MPVHYCARDSPWQNGAVERRGGTWKLAAGRTIDHVQLSGKRDIDLLCSLVTQARNAIPNATGYSPSQWVLGRQPTLFGSTLAAPHALASHMLLDSHPDLAKRAALMKSCQLANINLDRSERLRRALTRQSRPTRGPFLPGHQVYFWNRAKRGKKSKVLLRHRWCGPCVVVGAEGRSIVWESWRGTMVKVSPEMVRHCENTPAPRVYQVPEKTQARR